MEEIFLLWIDMFCILFGVVGLFIPIVAILNFIIVIGVLMFNIPIVTDTFILGFTLVTILISLIMLFISAKFILRK